MASQFVQENFNKKLKTCEKVVYVVWPKFLFPSEFISQSHDVESFSSQRREREILQELEKKEESTLEIKETFTSLREEVDLKTKKLNKVIALRALSVGYDSSYAHALRSSSPN